MAEIFFTQPDWQLFTNINTLPQQAGVAKNLLPRLVAKELTDNALDTGAQVEIAHKNDGKFNDTIIIRDRGEGFQGSNEEIAHLFSINRPLTSSKRLRLPFRGALGNGLRVVSATVYCTGGELQVATQGRRLRLIPQDDGTTQFEVIGDFNEKGTEIRVTIANNFYAEDILQWANLALEINQGEVYAGQSNPFWYDSDSFYNLLLSTPNDLKVGDFLLYFDKITKTKISPIVKELAQHSDKDDKEYKNQSISQLNREDADLLLGELRGYSKEVKPKKLGEVGTLHGFPAYYKEITIFEVLTTKGKYNAMIPAVVEAFGRESEEASQIFVNKTPITGEVSITYFDKRLTIHGCGLNETIEVPKLNSSPRIWVNIITPYMPIVSNGKEPDLSVLAEPIRKTTERVMNQLKRTNIKDNLPRSSTKEKVPSQKRIVIERLEEAIEKASGQGKYRYSLRQLYYVMRPLVMEYTGKELKYPNFNTIITEYEFDTGQDLDGVYRDERGTLLHPHSHEEIKLGTKTVEKYQRPIFSFNKILYSEKEGFFEILKDAGFCEKHDCALLTSKGFASRAARDVIDLLADTEEELLFFCIHDADLAGTLIYQALQGATKARPERKVKIINLGLDPWEGVSMGLEVESLERRSTKNPAKYVLEYDLGRENIKPFDFEEQARWADWQEWLRSRRIELNAMDTPTFLDWLDQKISKYSTGKVIPQENYLKNQAEINLQAQLKQKIREEILNSMSIDKLVDEQFEAAFPNIQAEVKKLNLEEGLRKNLENAPKQSWKQSFLEILGELLQEVRTK